jgi:hypothetical protein
MYPVQNYGEDFNKSMIGMGTFINGMQKSADDQAQRGVENARAERTLKAQEDTRDAAVRHSDAQTDKIRREEADAKMLQDYTEVAPEFEPANRARPKSEKALKILADVNARTAYTPNDLNNIDQHDKALNAMQGAVKLVANAPPSDKPLVVKRSDNIPVVNDILDANDFLRTNDLKQESHTNEGQIAELPKGAKYSVNKTEAYTIMSGQGTGSVTPWYSIVDDNGNPVMKQDGSPVLVPRTADRSNRPDARLDAVPIEALEAKVLFGKSVTDALKTLSPEEAKYVQERIHAKRVALGDKTAIRDDKPITLPYGASLVSSDGKVIAENAKESKNEVFTVHDGNNALSYQGDKSQPKSTWTLVGKSPLRVAAGMESGRPDTKAESSFVNNFWKSYTLPTDATAVTPTDKTNHARVEYLMNEGASRGVQMVQVYDPVASKYTAMPAAIFAKAATAAGVAAKKDKWGVINVVGRPNAMNALLNATGNKGAYPVSVMHPAYVQSSRQQAQEMGDERLQKMINDNANAL